MNFPETTIPDELYYDSVDLLSQLISIPSVSRNEKEAADCLERFFDRFLPSCPRKRIENNIILTDPEFDEKKPVILLNSHIDTVAPVDGWTRDPFLPELDTATGRLYGLGSNDAGASLVSLIAAFRHAITLPRAFNLVFVASAEEEVSGKNGLTAVIPDLPPVSVAIVGEPTSMNPAVAEKGLMVLDCVSRGVAGHAARNNGVNAIYKAIEAIEKLRNLTFPEVSATLGPVMISVTQIEGGIKHNVVPDICRFVADVRTTDAYSNLETLDMIRQAVGDTVELTPRSTRLNPSSVNPAHPIVRRLKIMGREPFGSPTLSDGALMPWQKVKIGPGESSRSHTADEFIMLDELRDAVNIYSQLLKDLRI